MNPEQRRTFRDVIHGGLRELIVHRSSTTVEIEGENNTQGENRDGKKDGAASALDKEELGGVGAAVGGDLAAGGVPDCEELGEDGCGAWHAAVVAAELDEEEDEDARESSDGGDVEEVLDVAVPRRVEVGVGIDRRRKREKTVIHDH